MSLSSTGQVSHLNGRWFFSLEAFGCRFRWEIEPSLQSAPHVGRAEWGASLHPSGLSSVLQGGQVVAWWRNDEPALKVDTKPVST